MKKPRTNTVTATTSAQGPGSDFDVASIAVAVTLSAVSLANFLLLPLIVQGAMESLRFSERTVGFLSAFIMVGLSAGALVAGALARRVSWRSAAALCLSGLILSYGASIELHNAAIFIALQFLGGLFGGFLYSIALTVLSDSRYPDRSFGLSLAVQTLLQVGGLAAGPALISKGGINAVLAGFAVLAVLPLLLIGKLPARGRALVGSEGGARIQTATAAAPLLLVLTGCFFFFCNVGCYWTFIEPIGRSGGMSSARVAAALVTGMTAGTLGALLAAAIRDRLGRIGPLAISAVAVAIAMLFVEGRFTDALFFASAVLYTIAWNFSLTYQYALVGAMDASGRAVAIVPAFHTAGGAAGAALAGALIPSFGHVIVTWLVISCVMVSFVAFYVGGVLVRPPGNMGQVRSISE